MFKQKIAFASIALALGCSLTLSGAQAADKQLKSIGITVGSLGNPYFVTIAKGAEAKAKQINPNVKVQAVSADYDMNKQFTQIDNFISAHVDLILLNAADPKAIEPAVKKAQAAGIVVVAVDVAAAGADATVQTNNVQAGSLPCEFIVEEAQRQGQCDHRERAAGVRRARPREGLQGGAGEEPGHQDPVRRPGRQGLARRRHERDAGLPHALPEDRAVCSRSMTRRLSAAISRPSSCTARTS